MKRDASDVTTRLLLALCRGELDDTGKAEITGLLAQPVDWDALAELAALHGVVGLVRRNLIALDARAAVPRQRWQQMQNAANQIAFDGVLQLRETDRMATVLNGVGIEPIVLKGHALAALLYGDPLLRPSADIDLLVARSDLARDRAGSGRCGLPADFSRQAGRAVASEATTSVWFGKPCPA